LSKARCRVVVQTIAEAFGLEAARVAHCLEQLEQALALLNMQLMEWELTPPVEGSY
jgi:hypothetical protein